MRAKVEKFISDNNLLCHGDEVTVGLSGGADSVALLYVLKDIAVDWNLKIRACHVNHCLRGEESDADEAFCRALCEKLCVPLTVCRCDVPEYCTEHGLSIETGAREVRYEALNSAAGLGFIATAHHLDDNAETMLLNLLRGTALDGLCGIPVRRGKIIRPLLCVTRAETETYLAEHGQTYCTDSTNLSDEATRNRLRHAVFPVLSDINPAVTKTMARTARILSADRDFLNSLADEKYTECEKNGVLIRNNYVALPDALRLRVLRRFLRQAGVSTDAGRLYACDALALSGEGTRPLNRRTIFNVSEEFLSLNCERESEKITPQVLSLDSLPIQIALPGEKRLEISILSRQDKKLFVNYRSRQFKNYLDCDKIRPTVILRSRQGGDAVRFAGRSCKKTLKKLFSENRIPPEKRDSVAVLTCGGRVAWVEGFGTAEEFVVGPETKRAVVLTVI